MWFEIHSNNEFSETPNGPINIDGALSESEKQELQEALQAGKEEIYDTTHWQLWDFLYTDVLPHLEYSGLSADIQIQIRALSQKHLSPSSIHPFEIPESLRNTLLQWELNLSLEQGLSDMQNYISDTLALPSDSNMSSAEHSVILTNIHSKIWERISEIDGIISEKRDQYPELSLRELTWIINAEINNFFAQIRDEIIFPAQLCIDFSSQETQSKMLSHMWEGASRENWSPSRIQRAQENMTIQMQELSYLLQDPESSSDNILYQYENILYEREFNLGDFETDMYVQSDETFDVSLLSEADKQIEGKSMLYFLCAVGVQCLPYVWALPGAAADTTDLFSSQDATLMGLKESGLVPEEYHIEKTWLDRVFAGTGLVLSAVWLQALAKSWKLAQALSGIRHLSPSLISESISLFAEKMHLSGDMLQSLKRLLWLSAEEHTKISSHIPNMNHSENIIESGTESFQRTIKHTSESYLSSGGRAGEFGFVDTQGQLHINTSVFDTLPEWKKAWIMREFIAHERAHQAILNLPEGKLREIHQHFMRNNVFEILKNPQKYELHIDRTENPLDITNEILAHMIGRMRVGKEVPSNILNALQASNIDDIFTSFGINSSRRNWESLWGVKNRENLSSAAMRIVDGQILDLSSFWKVDLENAQVFLEAITDFIRKNTDLKNIVGWEEKIFSLSPREQHMLITVQNILKNGQSISGYEIFENAGARADDIIKAVFWKSRYDIMNISIENKTLPASVPSRVEEILPLNEGRDEVWEFSDASSIPADASHIWEEVLTDIPLSEKIQELIPGVIPEQIRSQEGLIQAIKKENLWLLADFIEKNTGVYIDVSANGRLTSYIIKDGKVLKINPALRGNNFDEIMRSLGLQRRSGGDLPRWIADLENIFIDTPTE